MENLGLVTYRETALLGERGELAGRAATGGVDDRPRNGPHVVRRPGHHALVGRHWLNEAFATFMELLATDAFEPRWQIWTNFGIDRAAALATDGLRASRAIEYPVGRPEEVRGHVRRDHLRQGWRRSCA